MNKVIFFVSCIFILHCNIYSQSNRVLNPSFEKYIDTSINGFYGYGSFKSKLIYDWSDPNYTSSDLYTKKSRDNASSYPMLDGLGYQYPRSGNAFAGLNIFLLPGSFREFVQASFIDSLKSNKTYAIKYYVSLNEYAQCFTDLGFYFSRNKIDTLYIYYFTKPSINPQYENSNTNWINTFDGWQEMKGIYRASGGERYASIGNFTKDSLTNYQSCTGTIPSTDFGAYLYLDDVAIYDTSIIDTIKICMNDSIEINHQWYKPSTSIINEPFDSGVVVRHYIEALPNSASFKEIDMPYHIGDTVQAGFVWVCYSDSSLRPTFFCDSFDGSICYHQIYLWPTPDTFVDAYFQNVYGCDSTVRYHVRTNVGIEDKPNLENITIYPNPVNDYLYIDYNKSKKLFYTMYDISGKLIFDKKILTQTIDVSNLDKGMYILEIKDEDDNTIRKKVIKE